MNCIYLIYPPNQVRSYLIELPPAYCLTALTQESQSIRAADIPGSCAYKPTRLRVYTRDT
ncbi:hypothetical protein K9N68_21470 [Kovacikia minuta CCNUW1]|uniref:hypothetical protein n=1 Tax=Kovacikia minuta TaxID=2931930 RepID=UPI001CC9A20B|nr:hypothetical protein [Kovacikia minuta]UBF24269.1 hypothetical protein K9N68_21470 [Kovacikia minuta CCNUW1]